MLYMRPNLLIDSKTELNLISNLSKKLLEDGYNANNSFIITVRTDYSSIVGQLIRHNLSFDGEICEGFGIDVPYPDQVWDNYYLNKLHATLILHKEFFNKTPILVEAAVIRGGNYNFVVKQIKECLSFNDKIITLAMYENIDSKFKSNYVGSYYDNNKEDITFWWESDNKHWDQ